MLSELLPEFATTAKGHYASKCFKKQKEEGVRRIEEEPQANIENDSDTDEYDVAMLE